jgi:hypothetical protein
VAKYASSEMKIGSYHRSATNPLDEIGRFQRGMTVDCYQLFGILRKSLKFYVPQFPHL